MVIMDPDEVLRSRISHCVQSEVVVHSDVCTPVVVENLEEEVIGDLSTDERQ